MSDFIAKIQEILAGDMARGCYFGAVAVLAIWLFTILCRLWSWLRYNRRLISVNDDQNGAFQLSYATIIQHAQIMLKKDFPQLTVKNIRISHWGSYRMRITAQIGDHADIKAIRDAVRPAVKQLLDETVGIPGTFSKVDVTISSLRPSRNEAPAPMLAANPEPAADNAPAEDNAPAGGNPPDSIA